MRRKSNEDLVPWIALALAGLGTLVTAITRWMANKRQLDLQKMQVEATIRYWERNPPT